MQTAVSVMIVYLLTVYGLQIINFYADAQKSLEHYAEMNVDKYFVISHKEHVQKTKLQHR
jgi:hypothetical protein